MSKCIFCKIINKEIPSTIVYEDDDVIAFRDINPQVKIHILIVSKKHYEDITKIDDDKVFAKIFKIANIVAEKLGIKNTGFRVVTNIGSDAMQTVSHVHFHLLGGEKLSGKMG